MGLIGLVLLGCSQGTDESGDVEGRAVGALKASSGPSAQDDAGDEETVTVDNDAAITVKRGELLVQLEESQSRDLRRQLKSKRPFQQLALPPGLQKVKRELRLKGLAPLVSDGDLTRLQRSAQKRASRAAGGAARGYAKLARFYRLPIDVNADPEKAARRLEREPGVLSAEPIRKVEASFTPNDEFFDATHGWGLKKINAETAWDSASGSGVVVAVIDSGVDVAHPDLAPNIYENAAEIPGNGVDDDGNGFVDDVRGWDFVENDASPNDPNGHGTHVAGTIAAVANNAHGVAGVAHSAKIMPIRGLNQYGSGNTDDLLDALVYAIENGADVINNSWGGLGRSPAIDAAIQTAREAGIVVVNAAGNASEDACLHLPANSEHGITVAATDSDDVRSSYSNFGVKIDLAAPGGATQNWTADRAIFSTLSPNSVLGNDSRVTEVTGSDNATYGASSGTSMAAPHVAGVAALLAGAHPSWSAEQIRQALRQSATDVAAVGFDVDSGFGRLDAAAAVALSSAPPIAAVDFPYNCDVVRDAVDVVGSSSSTGSSSYSIAVGTGAAPTSFQTVAIGTGAVDDAVLGQIDTADFPDGTLTIRLQTSSGGTTSEERNAVTVDNVYIASPSEGDILGGDGSVTIVGKTGGNQSFQSYVLEYATGHGSSGPFTQITQSSSQVTTEGALGSWNLSSVPRGAVTLRLRAIFAGYESTETMNLIVNRSQMAGFPVTLASHTFTSPKIADLNHDGEGEIVLGSAVYDSSGALISGFPAAPGESRDVSAVLNIDSDPALEVVSADEGLDPHVRAYDTDGTILWDYDVPGISGYLITSVSAADVDGDGNLEVVFGGTRSSDFDVFVLDAASGSVKSSFSLQGPIRGGIALGDLDLDGAADLVMTRYLNSQSEILAMDSTGNLLPGWPQGNIASSYASDTEAVLGDVDGDMRLEVFAGKNLYSADGTLASGSPSYDSFNTTVLFPSPTNPDNMYLGQGASNIRWRYRVYDELGNRLHFSTVSTQENLLVLMLHGGAFQQFLANPLVADVDGDGTLDLLNSGRNGSTSLSAIPLYANDVQSGAMATGFPVYVNTEMASGTVGPIRNTPALGDLDGDGRMDLIAAGGDQLQVWNLGVSQVNDPWPTYQRDLGNSGTLPVCEGAMVDSPNTGLYGMYGLIGDVVFRGNGSMAEVGDEIAVAGTGKYDGVWRVHRKFMYAGAYSYVSTAPWTGQAPGWSTSGGGPAGAPARIYRCKSPEEVRGRSWVRLRHQQSEMCLSSAGGSGAASTSMSCSASPAARFELDEVEPGSFRIRHVATGQCLYGHPSDGGSVNHWVCWNDPNMVYTKEDAGGGFFRLRHEQTGKCIQIDGGGGVVNATCADDPTMKFMEY